MFEIWPFKFENKNFFKQIMKQILPDGGVYNWNWHSIFAQNARSFKFIMDN